MAIDHFTYAPMVRSRLSNAKCRIVERRPAYEATADCTALFTGPHAKPRQIRVIFDLSGIGVVNVNCDRRRASDPFCTWIEANP